MISPLILETNEIICNVKKGNFDKLNSKSIGNLSFENVSEEFNISGMLMDFDFRKKISDNVLSNKIINGYYKRLEKEYEMKPAMSKCIGNKIVRLAECNNFWELDYYKKQCQKIFKSTLYCKDKFCLNCKKWRQAMRMKKFLPELAKYDKDLYFVTFTVPNVDGIDVKNTISRIFKAHKKLTQYLDGTLTTKLTNLPILFNFIGGIRVLEISINRDASHKYHVHIHCAYVLKDYIPTLPHVTNAYSHDNSGKRKFDRKFTDEEITLQKFWYLCYEDINLRNCPTIDSFRAVSNLTKRSRLWENKGYSVTIDKFRPGEYSEMFKYMIKDCASYLDEHGNVNFNIISYEEFKVLYFATPNVRQLECYGVLKGIQEPKPTVDEIEVISRYNRYIAHLDSVENSETIIESPLETLKSDAIYLSKNKLISYFRKALLEEMKNNPQPIINNRISVEEVHKYKFTIEKMQLDEKEESRKKNTTSSNKVVSIVDI